MIVLLTLHEGDKERHTRHGVLLDRHRGKELHALVL
jgi:hypothetical protein